LKILNLIRGKKFISYERKWNCVMISLLVGYIQNYLPGCLIQYASR
jgi:hypothetical protein